MFVSLGCDGIDPVFVNDQVKIQRALFANLFCAKIVFVTLNLNYRRNRFLQYKTKKKPFCKIKYKILLLKKPSCYVANTFKDCPH